MFKRIAAALAHVVAAHELNIVDHDEVKPLRRGKTAAFGKNFRGRDARAVVDENLRFLQFIACAHEIAPLALIELARKRLFHGNLRIRA